VAPAPGNERALWQAALAAGLESSHDDVIRSADIADRPEAERSALHGCLAHLASSEAELLMVDLQDLWGEMEQDNRPGTGVEGGNWRHRSARNLEELRSDPGVAAMISTVERRRALSIPMEARLP
ncbi:MAG: 4-alpha-glucanotransferase, partial [Acidimicrobiales bacterium]